MKRAQSQSERPLAEQIRPAHFTELIGQKKALGPGTSLRRLLDSKKLPSLILWGPPGTGKTTFAQILSQEFNHEFVSCHAVESGAKILREACDAAAQRLVVHERKTILFVDEIHRLNKAQQDVLLPFVEKGDVILVGATTENPSFEINGALLSRCQLVVFERLSLEELGEVLRRALGFFKLEPGQVLEVEAQAALLGAADGDARRLISLAEGVVHEYRARGQQPLGVDSLNQLFSNTPLYYDKKSDQHYDVISAFIKSLRGSDPDAGIYYLVRMLESGEDPRFIARRMIIFASEDVGNADPRALQLALSVAQAVDWVGLPEAAINLAQGVTYLASAPKSNRSYSALRKAQAFVKRSGSLPVPTHLRNAPTETMKSLGYGREYQYAHDHDRAWVDQKYLPNEAQNQIFYEPSQIGFEKQIRAFREWLKGNHEAGSGLHPSGEKLSQSLQPEEGGRKVQRPPD